MSEFLKRWSSRKSEARKHQVLQPREEVISETVAAPIEGHCEGEMPDTELDGRVVSTDKGSDVPLPLEGDKPRGSEPQMASSEKPALPNKEALRAMFRSHKPDGLDDYTQDFSQPELLPAALSAGLRNWLVEQATAPDDEAPHLSSAAPEPATVAATAITSEPQGLADNHSQTPTDDRDILVDHDGQNVPTKGGGMEHLGS
ncbi:TPA: DUF3306 domain-containing protein [Aeromonas hydrophila]|uniref:DUF3306 domain-containing protein n=1 Tax=Aeromonas TaxID=642 RepID=UPI00090C1F51|nr:MULTISPECIES: DUF3306 domain-containing protein [Aeromonas]HEB4993437.1 DUF3306 domain-containing protein [Aeromonas hydrophila subsp. hydrophila]APJ16288.1 DUF3306 domain-containing protein [Aeromonas hydrophila]EHK5437196.1 DUF3306 domain-containing protein [Aeromonas hydrophila]MCK0185627.1 DUF3306 domain-containing protein [Aeromonas hydrophila]UCM58775.1 DUF3306 domain-containing protein [Aeromonas hydrophila]